MSSAGQVGGAVSPASLFNLKVSSKPKPLGPSDPVNLTCKQTHTVGHLKLCFCSFVTHARALWKWQWFLWFSKKDHSAACTSAGWRHSSGKRQCKIQLTNVIFSTPMKPKIRLCVLTREPCYLHTDHLVQNWHNASVLGRPGLDSRHSYTCWYSLMGLAPLTCGKKRKMSTLKWRFQSTSQ